MKNNAPAATKAEKDRIKRLFLEVGCICCLLRFGLKNSHIEIHHIVRGNKRLGHWYTLPLCHSHHQQKDKGAWTSIANGRKAFNAVHGTELDLWLKCQHMLGLSDELLASKVLPRRLPHVDALRSSGQPADPAGVLAGTNRVDLRAADARVGESRSRLVGALGAAADVPVGVPATGQGDPS